MLKLAAKLAVVMSLLLMILPVQAQEDGLSAEERELLDRVFIGLERLDSYSSYRLESRDQLTQSFSLFVGGQTLDIASERIRTEDRIFTRGVVGSSAQSEIGVFYLENTMGQEEIFTIEAEVRLVEGVLWVNATYAEPPEDVEPLPEGWTPYLTVDDIPGELDDLDLDSFLVDTPNPFENRELVESSVNSIEAESMSLDDGSEVDLITLTFEGAGFRNLLDQFVDPETTSDNPFLSVLASVTADGTISFSLGLTANNDPLFRETRLDLEFEDLEMGSVSEEFPPDAVLDLTLKIEETATLSKINGVFDEIEMPVQQ